MKAPDNDLLLSVARTACDVGARFLAQQYAAVASGETILSISEKESAIDLVTDIDHKAQEIIIAEIRKHFPDHRFIAEEEGADALGDPQSPYEWIIDPLDGTLNFIHGRENFGTIIAVQKDGKLLAGAMDMPILKQRFHGARGSGAFFNDKPVRLRATRGMDDAILCCNTMRRATKGPDGIYRVTVPACASVENYGCAAQEIGDVLRGMIDGAFFRGIRLWDIACGFLLIEEAGGRMRYEPIEPGNPRTGYVCAASTEPIFDELWDWVTTKMER